MARIKVRLADPTAQVPDVTRINAPLLPQGEFEADDAHPFFFALIADGSLVRVEPKPAVQPVKEK